MILIRASQNAIHLEGKNVYVFLHKIVVNVKKVVIWEAPCYDMRKYIRTKDERTKHGNRAGD